MSVAAIAAGLLLSAPAFAVRPDVGFRLRTLERTLKEENWGKSAYNKACRDPETCGSYGTAGRCRDAFCASCSLGTCETLDEAQACCLESSVCTAVYGGGAHWWTFNTPCDEEDHENGYNVWHRGGESPNPEPPATSEVPATPEPPMTPEPPVTPAPTRPGTPALSDKFPSGLISCPHPGDSATDVRAEKTECFMLSHDLGNADIGEQIRQNVISHYNSLPADCQDGSCPRGDLAGCLVRLVGHDIMDYNPVLDNGGADGCIDFDDPDNLGLQGCMLAAVHERDSSNVSLEMMWQDVCGLVSFADFTVIAAEALIEATVPAEHKEKWGKTFRENFRFGRQTMSECAPEPLPNPTHSCDAVQEVFVDRMGLSWTQATALMGVHTLGRALPENSGFDGFWVSQEHARTFDTTYYIRILGVGWAPESAPSGKRQWRRADGNLLGEMMLNTDMCLAYQTGGTAPLTRAEDSNNTGCCLWMGTNHQSMEDVACQCMGQDLSAGCSHRNCCSTDMNGRCGHSPFNRQVRSASHGESLDAVAKYAKTNGGMDSWHDDFMGTWQQVTTQGHEDDLCEVGLGR